MKPKRSELAASLKGSLKKNSESNFYRLFRPDDDGTDSERSGALLSDMGLCVRDLQMTTVWVKNSHWETKIEIPLRNRKQKYFQSCSIRPLPQWAFSCFSEHPPWVSSSQSVPQAARPQGAGPYEGPESSLENIYCFLLQRVTMPTNISEGLSFFQERTWLVVLYPLRFTHWECKIKMLPASPILWGSSQ